ncbi:hypothetical protein ABZ613_11960 [Streptomyces collinus]|uniref:hypothetical protein n=1 Tax=Streptomyces collinus TaxID=42684 RepID=UPI0033D8B674
MVAAAHSDGYAATGRLLGLLAALPAPAKAGERFWSDLWRSSGTAYLLPVNIKAPVLRSLAGEGTALARQVLSAVDEMTSPQRVAAGEVIGQALVESDHLPDLKTQVIGELWLRDIELTAWRVLHTDRRSDDPAGRKAFLDAWTRASERRLLHAARQPRRTCGSRARRRLQRLRLGGSGPKSHRPGGLDRSGAAQPLLRGP